MPIQEDPETLYPNSVADLLVKGVRQEFVDFETYHFGKELFRQEDGLEVHPHAYESTALFINCIGTEPLGERDSRKATTAGDELWLGRARVAHHNPRDRTEKGQEALIYAKRAQALLQGTKIPTDVPGVEGGIRLVSTGRIEEVLNIMDFAVYRFPLEIELQHDLTTDLT